MKNTLEQMYSNARENKVALVAANVSNIETVKAALDAAEKTKQAIILQTAPIQLQYQGISYLQFVYMVRLLAGEQHTYAIHLDHAETFEDCQQAVDAGFDSVMFDGSKLSYEDNERLTKQVCDYAHARGVIVEAELGRLQGNESGSEHEVMDEIYTDPNMAKSFVEATTCDALAVAIGNAHGFHVGDPKLDFERLTMIEKAIPIPIVLHGGTGINHQDIRRAISLGVRKINYFTELDNCFMQTVNQQLQENQQVLMFQALESARQTLTQEIVTRINLCSQPLDY